MHTNKKKLTFLIVCTLLNFKYSSALNFPYKLAGRIIFTPLKAGGTILATQFKTLFKKC